MSVSIMTPPSDVAQEECREGQSSEEKRFLPFPFKRYGFRKASWNSISEICTRLHRTETIAFRSSNRGLDPDLFCRKFEISSPVERRMTEKDFDRLLRRLQRPTMSYLVSTKDGAMVFGEAGEPVNYSQGVQNPGIVQRRERSRSPDYFSESPPVLVQDHQLTAHFPRKDLSLSRLRRPTTASRLKIIGETTFPSSPSAAAVGEGWRPKSCTFRSRSQAVLGVEPILSTEKMRQVVQRLSAATNASQGSDSLCSKADTVTVEKRHRGLQNKSALLLARRPRSSGVAEITERLYTPIRQNSSQIRQNSSQNTSAAESVRPYRQASARVVKVEVTKASPSPKQVRLQLSYPRAQCIQSVYS